MDPDANLAEQRRIVCAIQTIGDSCDDAGVYTDDQADALADHAARLAELVEALDEWIVRGGYLPEPWRNPLRDAIEKRGA